MPWKTHTIVFTVMALKGIEYEYRAVNLIKDGGEQKKEEYVKNKNPMGEVPTFVDGDTVLTQVLSLNSSRLHCLEYTHYGI